MATRLGPRDPVLALYAKTFEQRVSSLRGFALGLYAEYRVAHLLDATPSESGTDEIDLHWLAPTCSRNVRIQVKSAHRLDADTPISFSIGANALTGRRAGDLWIFARHIGSDHRTGWHYLVTKASRLRRFGDQKTISANKVTPLGEWVADGELRAVAATIAGSLRQW